MPCSGCEPVPPFDQADVLLHGSPAKNVVPDAAATDAKTTSIPTAAGSVPAAHAKPASGSHVSMNAATLAATIPHHLQQVSALVPATKRESFRLQA